MNKTKIEWVKNPDGTPGWTWNKVTGCLGPNGTPSNPKPCSYCYAHLLATGRLKKLYLSNLGDVSANPNQDFENVIPGGDPNDPFTPRHWPDRAIDPYKLKKPSTIFVCSMSELFGDYILGDWIHTILDACWELPQHIFQILTKNPARAHDFQPFPDNVWLGVTVNQTQDWGRVWILQNCQARTKFISFEPLLNNVLSLHDSDLLGLSWIIIGAQTKPTVLPKAKWVHRIIDTARHEGIPVFLKNNLHWPERIQEFPSELTLRRAVDEAKETVESVKK